MTLLRRFWMTWNVWWFVTPRVTWRHAWERLGPVASRSYRRGTEPHAVTMLDDLAHDPHCWCKEAMA